MGFIARQRAKFSRRASVGHFGFEKNRPASFKRPLYSFIGDWVMYKDIWTGKVPL